MSSFLPAIAGSGRGSVVEQNHILHAPQTKRGVASNASSKLEFAPKLDSSNVSNEASLLDRKLSQIDSENAKNEKSKNKSHLTTKIEMKPKV